MLDGKYMVVSKVQDVLDLVDLLNGGFVEIQSILPEMAVHDAMNNEVKMTIIGVSLNEEREKELETMNLNEDEV